MIEPRDLSPIPINEAEKERLRAERNARDAEIINQNSDELNADAEDGLDDQAPEGQDDENEFAP